MGYGNDTEIGDPGKWRMNATELAQLLEVELPEGYGSDILLQACAKHVANLSAHVAVALTGSSKLAGVWLYGYNRPVDIERTLPDPATLKLNVELQGTQVT